MAGYIGNIKLIGYLGNVKIKGYLGNVKVLGGEPWEEAIELVGYSAASLDDVLKNSTICTALAGNTDAVAIMRENYSTEMTATIDSNFNDGLNLLNFKCRAKTYLFRDGNTCSNITGGWTADNGSIESTYIRIAGYWDQNKADSYDGYGGEAGGAYTVNKIDVTGFSKYGCSMSVRGSYGSSSFAMGGSSYNGNSHWYAEGYCQNTFLRTKDDTATATYYTTETMGSDKYVSVRTSDPGEINNIIYSCTGYFYSVWVE